MKMAVFDFALRKKGVYGVLHIIILLLSLFLVISISIDTFKNIPFYTQTSYKKIQLWICLFFLFDFVLELFLSKDKLRYLRTHFIFLLVAIPYQNIIEYYHIITSPELSYFLRFVPLVRGGYALAIVVGWLSYNKASGLFVSYLTMLLATVYFSSLIFFVLEHKVNPLVANYGDALWWAFMDVTTVGSNISAITVTGRVLSVVLDALGMMMFPIFTVYVTSLVQKSNEEKKRFYENIQAILMCFVPACFEILGMILLAPRLLGVSILDAAIMGTVVGAVSPAVIVPKMLKLMEENYGTGKGIPQLILAGASVDDVFVIVLFTAFTGLAQGDAVSVKNFVNIPVSIALGIVVGMTVGYLMAKFFEKIHIRDTSKVMIFLCVSFILVTLEDQLADVIPFASLIAVMAVGITLQKKRKRVAERLSFKFNKLWVVSEIMLFVLVGATVNIKYALSAGFAAVILIFGVLVFRMVGVFFCLLKTGLNRKERTFCMIAYMPKATVQAAIGGIPLAMGLSCGNIVLTVAVVSILITAPLGAFLIDFTYQKLLSR